MELHDQERIKGLIAAFIAAEKSSGAPGGPLCAALADPEDDVGAHRNELHTSSSAGALAAEASICAGGTSSNEGGASEKNHSITLCVGITCCAVGALLTLVLLADVMAILPLAKGFWYGPVLSISGTRHDQLPVATSLAPYSDLVAMVRGVTEELARVEKAREALVLLAARVTAAEAVATVAAEMGAAMLAAAGAKETRVGSHTPACLASGSHENVVFTLGNAKYKDLIAPWSRRLHALSWHQQYFSALDSETARHIEHSEAVLCTIPFYSAPQVHVKESTRLPTNVGLAKFATMQMLLERGHRTITMTEMDVYWFADPRAEIETVLSRRPVAAQENYPWEPQKANAGFVTARNEPRVLRLFADMTSTWAGLTAKNGNLARTVAAEQVHLQRLLHSHNMSTGIYLDRGAVATLNLQERSGGSTVFHAGLRPNNYHSARVNWFRWGGVKGDDQPHVHFGGLLRVLHITGVSEEFKLQLTQLLYFEAAAMGTPVLTAAEFCEMTWSNLIHRCSRLATKLQPGRNVSAVERRKVTQAGQLRALGAATRLPSEPNASGAAS